MNEFIAEFRQSARALLRRPIFTLAAVLTLAVGTGATTAMFSVVNGVVLKPLGFREPAQLVRLFESSPRRNLPRFSISEQNYQDWKAGTRAFTALAAYDRQRAVTLAERDGPRMAEAARLEPALFSLLGVAPMAGRVFTKEEASQRSAVAVASHRFWQRELGGDPAALGRTLVLDGVAHTLIGIMPPRFEIPGNPAGLWTPLLLSGDPDRGSRYLRVLGRMHEGVTPATALEDLQRVARGIAADNPRTNNGWTVALFTLNELSVGVGFRKALVILLGVAGLVLLVACANVANLILVRNTARERELSVRAALGASRTKLARHLLSESILLAATGTLLGLLMCSWLIDLVRNAGPTGIPRLDDVAIDAYVLGFSAGVGVLMTLLFGLLPALRGARRALQQDLRYGAGMIGGGRTRAAGVLVSAQIALSVVLVAAAALLVQSFVQLQRVEAGFRSEGVAAMRIALPQDRYSTPEQGTVFFDGLMRRLSALPGVQSVAASSGVPFADSNNGTVFVRMSGPAPKAGEAPDADFRIVTSGYFAALGIPVLNGRDFARDRESIPKAVLISRSMASQYWPGVSPIGERIRVGDVFNGPEYTVIGVVADARYYNFEVSEIRPMMYFLLSQDPTSQLTIVVRTSGDVTSIAPAMRRAVHELDRAQPLPDVQLMSSVLSDAKAQRRFNAWVFASLGGIALLLAIIGVYGITSYAVSQRTREIGLRIALGARPQAVVWHLTGRAMMGVLIGAGIGTLLAFASAGLLSSLVYGITANDATTLGGVPVILALIAFAASYLPARRAAQVDAIVTLRQN